MATVNKKIKLLTKKWVGVRDLMLSNPGYLCLSNKVSHARIFFAHSRFAFIPVVYRNGTYAGIIERDLIKNQDISAEASIEPYIDSSVMPLEECEPISILKTIPVKAGLQILPVVSERNRLTGIIPNPAFLKDILGDIIKYFDIVAANQDRDISALGVIIVNSKGEIVVFNENIEKIIGIKGQDVYGKHINKVIPDLTLHQVLKTGYSGIKTILSPGKSPVGSFGLPLLKGNEIIGAIGIASEDFGAYDLNERIKILRGLNLELLCIFESISDGILVLDENSNVIRTNATFEAISGLSANKILGTPCGYWDKDLDCSLGAVVGDVLEKKKAVYLMENIKGRDYLIIAKPVFDGNCELTNVVLLLKDIYQLNELIMNLELAREITSNNRAKIMGDEEVRDAPKDMIAKSMAMRRVVSFAHKVAKVDSNVLIMGETGVGKEVVARSIHNCSYRMDGPFIKLNCGEIPEPLLESELFGYEAGAFTGAKKEGKAGLIELADGGTLFLDEVADLPLNLQVKLLRVLQEREVMRVGGTTSKKVDFRLIAATNKNLEQMVEEKTFRKDLYYRLNVVPIIIPPLRDRKEDIISLVVFFLNKFNRKYRLNKKVSPEVIQVFLKYEWPGNVRELENTIERLVVTSEADLIDIDEAFNNPLFNFRETDNGDEAPKSLSAVLEETEKKLLIKALGHYKTTRKVATALGISQSAVVKKIKKYGLGKHFYNEL